jgi:hypothetical protein
MRPELRILQMLVTPTVAPIVGADPTTTIITHGFSIDSKGDCVQAMAGVIEQMLAGVEVVLDFDVDGLREQPPSSVVKSLRQHILTAGRWKHERVGDRLVHGGVLLARMGRWR